MLTKAELEFYEQQKIEFEENREFKKNMLGYMKSISESLAIIAEEYKDANLRKIVSERNVSRR